ncbi:MAG: hypothetical protein K8R46_12585 [Pirellulales bacterium]|nr:hypothetical protein [Pirellulales bacterium]
MDTPATRERHRLIRTNYERIEYLYEDSVREGVADPLIFLLDIRDPSAKAMAEDWAGKEVVEGHVIEAKAKEVDHCLLLRFAREDAIKLVAPWPWKGKTLLNTSLPPGVFYIVALGGGGITCVSHKNPQ